MCPVDPPRASLRLMALVMLTFAVFSIWPHIDLWVTGLFHVPGRGFPLDASPVAEGVRQGIWRLSEAMILLALVALGAVIGLRRPVPGVPARVWGFILLLYALGPGLLVDGILKRFWGRARPADVSEFGGSGIFTAPHDITQECARNCSFVAGEMAGAVALGLSIRLVLDHLAPRLDGRLCRAGRWVAVAFPVLAGLHRIAAGRHFVSDVLLSALFVLLVACGLAAILRPCPVAKPATGC